MTTPRTEPVTYEGMDCPHCEQPLALIPQENGVTVEIFCELCGPIKSLMTTPCGGHRNRCRARIFFGGKSGKVPVSIATGSSHFGDCPDAARFRKHR